MASAVHPLINDKLAHTGERSGHDLKDILVCAHTIMDRHTYYNAFIE